MSLQRRSILALPAVVAAASLARPAAAQGAGVLRIAVGGSLRTLDVTKTTTGEEYIYDVLVFSGLTRIREDQTIEPDLAESWTYSEDLRNWTFRLRQGVKFHNGREMTSQDVVATYRRILDPETGCAARSNYEMIEGMEAPDAHTVVFRLSYPYGGFADILADRQAKIVPHDGFDALATQPVGTGPFMFRSYTPGDRLVLVKNPNYFEPGRPKLEGVEIRIMPEMAVRVAALQAGDIDVVWDLGPENIRALKEVAAVRVESIPTATWDAAILNNAIKPFDDARVRRAFHMAAPKQDVVQLVLFGEGAPTHSPIPPNHPFFNKEVPFQSKADVAGAKALLAQAGYPRGIKLPIIVPVGRPLRDRLGVTLQQLLRPAGFELEVQRVPYARYSAEVSGKAPLFIDGYFARPTVDTATYPFLHSKGSWNERLWHYNDPRMDKALEAARLTGDPEQQKKHYLEMQAVLADNPVSYFSYTMNFACGYRGNVKGVATHPLRWFDLRDTTMAA
ncbi:ABC transporter substrate-binding protein [Roseomonas sp. KE0001]|uniref:ABC transporter substrate-binding protein n=1 Tax=Roseomonas sp. KE0001 TaxID=2479201 RepID=UPI0018DEF0FC|nr:ABC transporter substrate-binding protein [Roseomonas sp. KE0001]MBI0435888.1 ABC transporter substrate-binding protein [Roseomonas sp. KE0001]